MTTILRVLVGLAGALFVFLGLMFWVRPDTAAANLGLEGVGLLGHSTLRADMCAFFVTGGGLALLGAIRARASLLTAPAMLIGLALTGRFLSVAVDGFDVKLVQPMSVEALLLVLFVLARLRLPAD